MTPEFRAGERDINPRLTCTECGGPAQGNASWTDGSGEICDSCTERDDIGSSGKPFHLGDILSVVTGRLFAPSGFEGVRAIFTHMLGSLSTDIACVVMRQRCADALVRQHPKLASVECPRDLPDAKAWLDEQITAFRASHLLVRPL